MIQRLFTSLSIAVVVMLATPVALADEPSADEPVLTFVGGGWGHGVGASQYGMLGRALAGHSHQEILAFYYDATAISDVASLGLGVDLDDVDVLMATRSTVAFSPPNGSVGWEIEITVGGASIATATRPVTAWFDGSLWHATVIQDDATTLDLCGNGCAGAVLTAVLDPGERVVVEQHENGPNVGEFAHGTIELVPQGATTSAGIASQCGSAAAHEFCVVNASMTLDEYLHGLEEIPASWPAAALAAQAVAARTYAVSRMRSRAAWSEPFDLYSTTSDQHYTGWGMESRCATSAWCAGVDGTSGDVVTHRGNVIEAVYSSSNGGFSAANSDVWGSPPLPYLRAKPDPFDTIAQNPNASWERRYRISDIGRWLTGRVNGADAIGEIDRIEFLDVPPSGFTDVATVVVHGSNGSVETGGYRFWSAMRQGCAGDTGCAPLPGRRFRVTSFYDVPVGAYFAVPVEWMTEHEITSGVGANTFGPGLANTRAGLATFLHRFADEPDTTLPTPFVDVEAGAYYERAVGWAADERITSGMLPEWFVPHGIITRAQAAVMLWRFAGGPAPSAPNPFHDVPDDAYYARAVRWMVEWGITTGTSDTTFAPADTLTRGQIATFLWRLAGEPDAFADGHTLPSAMRAS